MLKVKLTRNLRRSVLRGHPWIYREAVSLPTPLPAQAQMVQVQDAKGFLAWALFDPHSPLCLRILSLEKSPPVLAAFTQRLERCWDLRAPLREGGGTDCYRLVNGEGDLLPGLVCDLYGKTAVLQFDGQGPGEFWEKHAIAAWLVEHTSCESVVEKFRRKAAPLQLLAGQTPQDEIVTSENQARFKVNIAFGQKTGFFLDQRENRLYVRHLSRNQRLLNLFSYSGGFSVNAGLGGADHVTSVDLAPAAIELANDNWAQNGLSPAKHEGISEDVFKFLEQDGKWDHVLVDPPSMSHAENQRESAKTKYTHLFAEASRKVKPSGSLSLSSCSSHVSFPDFFEIIEEALSLSRRRGQILRVSGQGPDHPFPHACPELRYLKFVHLVLS